MEDSPKRPPKLSVNSNKSRGKSDDTVNLRNFVRNKEQSLQRRTQYFTRGPFASTLAHLSDFSDNGLKTDKIDSKQENNGREDIQGGAKYENHASDGIACQCGACLTCPKKQEVPEPCPQSDFFSFAGSNRSSDIEQERDFNLIMKYLLLTRKKERAFRLLVPDTAVLIDGEIKFIVTSKNVNRTASANSKQLQ